MATTRKYAVRDCCIKANRCVAFGIRLRSHTEVCALQTSPSAPCASSFLQSLDNLACKIVRLLTFATVSVRLSPHRGYRSSLVTPSSRRIRFLRKNFPNSSLGNQKCPRRKEKILRRNQMKLRRNQIISPKNLPFPREQIKNIHQAIWEFLGRNWNKLTFIMRQS